VNAKLKPISSHPIKGNSLNIFGNFSGNLQRFILSPTIYTGKATIPLISFIYE
jgi:hypothetical protein